MATPKAMTEKRKAKSVASSEESVESPPLLLDSPSPPRAHPWSKGQPKREGLGLRRAPPLAVSPVVNAATSQPYQEVFTHTFSQFFLAEKLPVLLLSCRYQLEICHLLQTTSWNIKPEMFG